MTINIEELRKVYDDAWMSLLRDHTKTYPHEESLLAVYLKGFKDGAERQRAVEPTREMILAGTYTGTHWLPEAPIEGIYRAMSAVAPLVVPE